MKDFAKKLKIFRAKYYLQPLIILLFMGGCSKDPLVKLKTESLETSEKRAVYEEIAHRNSQLKNFRSLAHVKLGSGIMGGKGAVSIAYIRPSWLRMDGISDFGFQDPQILVKLGEVFIYWPSSNSYYHGLATDAVMAKYFHFSMHPEMVADILAGIVPLDDMAAYRASKILGIENHYLLKSDIHEMIVMKKNEHFFPVRVVERSLDGLKRYQIDYSDFRPSGSGWLPTHMKVRFWDPHLNAEIWYSGPEMNLPHDKLDKKDFEINIPSDATQIKD